MKRTFRWQFDSPPEAVWPLLADTVRFNEAAGVPRHAITETRRPDGGSVQHGRLQFGPLAVTWREVPLNWVWNHWFRHSRVFDSGPFRELTATLTLTPTAADGTGNLTGAPAEDATGTLAEYDLDVVPRGLLGRLILLAGFHRQNGRRFGRLAAQARDFAGGRRDSVFDIPPPRRSPQLSRRAAAIAANVEATPYGHGAAHRLATFLLNAADSEVERLRPLALARPWSLQPREATELFLEATKAGLLDMRWDVLCPRCRVAKASAESLDDLPRGAHCSTCDIDYDSDFSQNVELSFRPAPAIRDFESGAFCLAGPMSTPHIKVHVTVLAGDSVDLAVDLSPGLWRLRTLEPGPSHDLDWAGGAFPEVVVNDGSITTAADAAAGHVRLTNRSRQDRTVVIEDRTWTRDALTADRVTTLQAFRSLFSDQVLRPGDEVSISHVSLMFTDLRGSTALYGRVGDATAYRLVRDHFAFLADIVRRHDGAVVKTIGDAVMASFHQPADALRAALAIQAEVATFNHAHPDTPILIRLGLHAGPCIAVTLNDRLDYFGSTVNLAARLQGESQGGDIVLSAAVRADPEADALLDGLPAAADQARLKGFDEPVPFVRLATGQSGMAPAGTPR